MADWTDRKLPTNVMDSLEVNDLAVNYDISAGTVYSKNSATAWVNFDGTTTPPTIRDSFNVRDVVRTATGKFDVYFSSNMTSDSYAIASLTGGTFNEGFVSIGGSLSTSMLSINTREEDGTLRDYNYTTINIFGGK